jgi:hypothetical protein
MVAARGLGQRMPKHRAFHRVTGHDELLPRSEIFPGLFLVPGRGPFRERFQWRDAMGMAGDASCVSGALLQEDGLDTLFEKCVIQRGPGGLGVTG